MRATGGTANTGFLNFEVLVMIFHCVNKAKKGCRDIRSISPFLTRQHYVIFKLQQGATSVALRIKDVFTNSENSWLVVREDLLYKHVFYDYGFILFFRTTFITCFELKKKTLNLVNESES